MKFLLDGNAVIAMLKGHAPMLERLRRHRPDDFGIPAIVMHELVFGACNSRRAADNLARIDALPFEVVAFGREDAERAGAIRAHLAAAGTPIGPYDVLIAGQALARGLAVVTHNTREFRRVPGLAGEDWE